MRLNQFTYLFFFVLMFLFPKAFAQSFSYVYIQGDKQTPFYVKMEDQMQPRFGKDYCIIPQLAPGIIHIEVLFQQNAFPSQKFTILVPENNYRGFLLTHKGNAFSLYDIQQQFYLPAGNKEEDDRMPASGITKDIVEPVMKADTTHTKVDIPQKQDNAPQFMGDIELNSDKSIQSSSKDTTQTNIATDTPPVTKPAAISNSDCPKPVGSSVFETIYNKMQKHNDKGKLKFLLDNLDRCYTASQVRILTKALSEDPERFEFLKQAYPRVTDQSNYSMLENLLSTQEWKDQFHQTIK